MNNKFIRLRKAISMAVAIIGSSYSLHASAIGLGDMHVKSFIGQQLVADLKVYGVDSTTDTQCFRVKSDDSNTINNLSFNLKRSGDGNATLTIKSPTPVVEPIVSVTIMNTCGSVFTRQYNLLIDPAPTAAIDSNIAVVAGSKLDDTNVATNASNEKISNLVTADGADISEDQVKIPSTKKSSRKNIKSVKNKEKKTAVNKQNLAIESQQKTRELPTNNEVSKPWLTISGGNLMDIASSPVRLNFDKSINVNRPIETVATQIDESIVMSDELTVMQNRLSHLDKQLSELSIQNANLKANSQKQANELTTIKQQNDFLRILSFCLGGALLASSYFFADWLRRRNAKLKEQKEQELWHAMQLEQEKSENEKTFEIKDDFVSKANDTHIEVTDHDDVSVFEESSEIPSNKIEATNIKPSNHVKKSENYNNVYSFSPASQEIVQEETDLLDDAELFLSHGRKNLAIQLLQNHLAENPKESVSIWMYLLDLLSKEGLEKEYDIAAKECVKHFNVNIATFKENQVIESDENSFESFERLSNELQKIWGTPAAITFLDKLIYNTRLEPRMGFSKAVFEELHLLREIAQDEITLNTSIEKDKSANKEPQVITELNLPNLEISEEFKQFGNELATKNAPKKEEPEAFEFELMDLNHR